MPRSNFLAAFVNGALTSDFEKMLADGVLTQAEYDTAIQQRAYLTNKATVGLNFAHTLGTDSNLDPGTPPNSHLNVLLQDPAYHASIAILQGVNNTSTSVIDALHLISDASLQSNPNTPANESADYIIANAPQAPVVPGQYLNYTTAIDHLVGGAGDDTFTGSIGDPITGDTLQSGDTANGNGGDDQVNVAIYGSWRSFDWA